MTLMILLGCGFDVMSCSQVEDVDVDVDVGGERKRSAEGGGERHLDILVGSAHHRHVFPSRFVNEHGRAISFAIDKNPGDNPSFPADSQHTDIGQARGTQHGTGYELEYHQSVDFLPGFYSRINRMVFSLKRL